MRLLIRLVLLLAVLLTASPFVISSLLIDGRGILIPGRIFHKDEYIVVHNSDWTRRMDVSVEYHPPDGFGSVACLKARVAPGQFDQWKKGDLVQVRYLRREDVPDWPGAKALRGMGLLPVAHLADQRAWSGLQDVFALHRFVITASLLAILVLILWRWMRVPYFPWAVGACVLSALAVSFIAGFPTPMPPPQHAVQTASGIVKRLDRWEWIFRDNHSRGFQADQPIQIVGVQFVPDGKVEPVVAVDLIDDGSLPGLKEQASVTVDYEAASPRVAYLRGATRDFARRNLRGMIVESLAALVTVVALIAFAKLLGAGYRKLVRSRTK